MKKYLLVSTLVIASSGAAFADVSLSGDARMGIASVKGGDYNFSSRARVRFSLSGETDSGLKFGAQFRANEAADTAASDKGTGTVFIEMPDYGKLTMGDTDGAVQAAVTQLAPIGFDDTQKLQEFTFLTGGDTGKGKDLLYTYTSGALSFSASIGNPGAASGSGSSANKDDSAIGVAYTTEFWKVAAGYEDNGVNSQTVLSGSYGNGQFEVKGVYGQRDDDKSQYVVYGTYIIGTNTLTAFYRDDEIKATKATGFGVAHDFGSGLVFSAGYAKEEAKDANVSVGLTMAF
ncbi:porin [Paragemmobacter aquarius]|nr:porin [Gemmobacter aquarius]